MAARPRVPQPNGQDWYDWMQRDQNANAAYVPNPNPKYVPNPGQNPMPGQVIPPNSGSDQNPGPQAPNTFDSYRECPEAQSSDTDSTRRHSDSSQAPNDSTQAQDDPLIDWEAEFWRMKAENDTLKAQNRDFRNNQNPLPRAKSLYELGQDAKGRIDTQYSTRSRLSMLLLNNNRLLTYPLKWGSCTTT